MDQFNSSNRKSAIDYVLWHKYYDIFRIVIVDSQNVAIEYCIQHLHTNLPYLCIPYLLISSFELNQNVNYLVFTFDDIAQLKADKQSALSIEYWAHFHFYLYFHSSRVHLLFHPLYVASFRLHTSAQYKIYDIYVCINFKCGWLKICSGHAKNSTYMPIFYIDIDNDLSLLHEMTIGPCAEQLPEII